MEYKKSLSTRHTNEPCTDDKRWYSSTGVGHGANKP
jgi:hypothetical protein